MNKKLEMIKSVALVCLLVSALFMSQAIFYDEAFAKISDESVKTLDLKKINDYIIPQSFYASFGGLSYTKVYNNALRTQLWSEIRPVVLTVLSSDFEFLEIDKKTYVEKFQLEGLLIKMPVAFDTKDLFDVMGEGAVLKKNDTYVLDEMLFVLGEPNRMYFYDGSNNKYYSVESSYPLHDLKLAFEKIKETDYIEYRTVQERYSLEKTLGDGKDVYNYTLIPFEYTQIVPEYEYQSSNFMDEQKILQAVFDSQLSFVKTLVDVNGSKIYMYGYGSKVLTLLPNGSINYKAKVQSSSPVKVKLSEAIALASDSIAKFGVPMDSIFLSRVALENDEWTLYFGYHIGSYKLVDEDAENQPIMVKIKGREIVDVRLNVIGLYAIPYYKGNSEMYRVDACLDKNYNAVSSYYFQDKDLYEVSENAFDYFFDIHSEIQSIEMRYYSIVKEDKTLFIPVWQIVIGKRAFIFDAVDGTLMKTYIQGL